MNNETLEFIQEQLEYEFDEPKLLKQAFTRRSYAEEHKGVPYNEVLEFYGDKALEFVVMKRLSSQFGETNAYGQYVSQKAEGELTDFKKNLVCKQMLAHRIDELRFAEYLLMGNGDIIQEAQHRESVKEDLFEAIVGAVAIDCNWNVDVLEMVVDKMLDMSYYFENGFQEEKNFVELVQNWCQKKYMVLPTYEMLAENGGYRCALFMPGMERPFFGKGASKQEARMEAARNAVAYIEQCQAWVCPIDEIGYPDLDRAINQLQELYQKGYIGEPLYDFSEIYDENGNPIWHCECHIKGNELYFEGEYSSKKYGKKAVAYGLLCDLFDGGTAR